MRSKILPRQPRFFDLFSQHAALSMEGARQLRAMLDDLHDAESKSARIRALEHEADDLCQATMELLHRSFVTPIDRGDIHEIASRLDDIMDNIEESTQRLWLYEITVATREAREMADLLVRATEAVKQAVDALGARRNVEEVRKLCDAIKTLETGTIGCCDAPRRGSSRRRAIPSSAEGADPDARRAGDRVRRWNRADGCADLDLPERPLRRRQSALRLAQLVSASFMAFSHGSNDAQKTMGVITLALFAGGAIGSLEVPLWVKIASALMMGAGTYVGGKRIIRTLGMRL